MKFIYAFNKNVNIKELKYLAFYDYGFEFHFYSHESWSYFSADEKCMLKLNLRFQEFLKNEYICFFDLDEEWKRILNSDGVHEK